MDRCGLTRLFKSHVVAGFVSGYKQFVGVTLPYFSASLQGKVSYGLRHVCPCIVWYRVNWSGLLG